MASTTEVAPFTNGFEIRAITELARLTGRLHIPEGWPMDEGERMAQAIAAYIEGSEGMLASPYYGRVQQAFAAAKLSEDEPLHTGRVVVTPGVIAAGLGEATGSFTGSLPDEMIPLPRLGASGNEREVMVAEQLRKWMLLHQTGDWGECDPEDRKTNDDAAVSGQRVMGVRKLGEESIWLITEWDRSMTTILLPNEY